MKFTGVEGSTVPINETDRGASARSPTATSTTFRSRRSSTSAVIEDRREEVLRDAEERLILMAVLDVQVVATDHAVGRGRRSRRGSPGTAIWVFCPEHMPVLAALAQGELVIEPVDGPPLKATVSGGFFSVDSDQVTIVADDADLINGRPAPLLLSRALRPRSPGGSGASGASLFG